MGIAEDLRELREDVVGLRKYMRDLKLQRDREKQLGYVEQQEKLIKKKRTGKGLRSMKRTMRAPSECVVYSGEEYGD